MLSIRTRLLTVFFLLVTAGFAFLVRHLLDQVRPHYLQAMEETLVDTATVLASLVSAETANGTLSTTALDAAMREAQTRRFQARIYELVKTRQNLRVYVTDAEGTVRYDSAGQDVGRNFYEWNDVLLTLRGSYGARATRQVADDPRTSTLYVGAPIRHGGQTIGVLTVAKPVDSVTLFLDIARGNILYVGLSAGLVVLLMGFLVTWRLTRPIRDLTRYAQAVRDGGKPTLPSLGRNEIGTLGTAFEEMRDALEGKQYVERYVQTLAHEFKGPLAAIRGAAELLAEGGVPPARQAQFVATIRAETERLENGVERLLQLSALESRKVLQERLPVNLREVVEGVLDELKTRLGERRASLSASGDTVVEGERFLLRQACLNLLQNAIDFTGPEGRIEIAVTGSAEGVTVTVADDGPGLPDYALERAFERFYSLPRPATGKKSTGLGLAFVREAVQLHQGRTSLANRPERGAIARIDLPRSTAAD